MNATRGDGTDSTGAGAAVSARSAARSSNAEEDVSGVSRAGGTVRTILPRIRLEGGDVQLQHTSETRFQTVRPLGEGALGEVVLARDHDVQRMVAVKTLKSRRHDASSVARFIEEVKTVGQLEHPNIAPLHDVGVDEQ